MTTTTQTQANFSPWWGGKPAPSMLPYCIAVACAIAAVLLLVSFWQVVDSSVARGEIQRQSWAAKSDVFRNCRANPDLASVCGRKSNRMADSRAAQHVAVVDVD